MIVSIAACVWFTTIFFVALATLMSFDRTGSQNESNDVPKASASSVYIEHVFVATIVRKLVN